MSRLASRKSDDEWAWEHSQMLKLGWEFWVNKNDRKFFKHDTGQLMRTKAVGKYLNDQGRFYDGSEGQLEERSDAGTSLLQLPS